VRIRLARASALVAAPLLGLLLVAGCSKPVSEWDRLERDIARARENQNHPRAVELSRQLVVLAREFPPVDSTRLVHSYDVLQQTLMAAGNFPFALEYQNHVIGLIDGMQRPDSVLLRRLLVETADCLRRLGKSEEAERFLTRAVELHRAASHTDVPAARQALAALARTNAVSGRYAAAEALQREAIEVRAADADTVGLDRALLLASLAEYVDQLGRPIEAESLYTQALRMGERRTSADHPMTAPLELAYGSYLYAHARHAEAVPHLERGIRLSAASPAYDGAEQAEQLHRLSGSAARVGDWEAAREAAERAIALRENADPPVGPLPHTWVNELGIIYVQLGRSHAAESLQTRYPGTKPDPER